MIDFYTVSSKLEEYISSKCLAVFEHDIFGKPLVLPQPPFRINEALWLIDALQDMLDRSQNWKEKRSILATLNQLKYQAVSAETMELEERVQNSWLKRVNGESYQELLWLDRRYATTKEQQKALIDFFNYSLNPLFLQLVSYRNNVSRELGFRNYAELEWIDAKRSVYKAKRILQFVSEMQKYLSKWWQNQRPSEELLTDSLNATRATYTGMGFGAMMNCVKVANPVNIKEMPFARAYFVSVPEDIRIMADTTGDNESRTVRTFSGALHEMGHCLSVMALPKTKNPLINRSRSFILHEAYASLGNYLMLNRTWLRDVLGVPEDSLDGCVNHLVSSFMCDDILFEARLHLIDHSLYVDGRDGRAAYKETKKRFPYTYWGNYEVVESAYLSYNTRRYPFSGLDHFEGLLLAGVITDYLTQQCQRLDWFRDKRAGRILFDMWSDPYCWTPEELCTKYGLPYDIDTQLSIFGEMYFPMIDVNECRKREEEEKRRYEKEQCIPPIPFPELLRKRYPLRSADA